MTTDGTTRAAPPPDAPLRNRAAERLLAGVRAETARADNKAAVLVAALGMTAGVFSGLLAGRQWTPGALSGPGTIIWWSGSAALALSLFSLLLAVLPRYRTRSWRPGQPLSYFGDIQQAARAGQLVTALADTEREPTAGLAATLAEISHIAMRKHQWIRAGLITFCTGTILLPASLLIG
ncbi:Pycsar system effector family protein [Streptomyces huasconensis]|uniref:Pycsar system effector family protein n=1 Tax=Streptomyces huasconensis TaxID=1854574 RepID=UPI0037024BFA